MKSDLRPQKPALHHALFSMILVLFVFVLPLFLWRLIFTKGDWAVLALLPLFFMIYKGCYEVLLRRRQAVLLAALQSNSALLGILKGRLTTFLPAFVIAILTTAVLAFEAITITPVELIVLGGLGILALGSYKIFLGRLQSHFNEAFLPALATTLSVMLAGLAASPLYAWVELNHVIHPGFVQSLPLTEAIRTALEQSGLATGPVSEVLSAFFVLDTTKIWLVVNAEALGWPAPGIFTMVYIIVDTAICFLIARAIVAVAAFFQFGLKNWRF